ncbi:MAG: 3'(2'),5'-bisphosphate nucleotidase CysQ [Sandaracinaceae bacterium]|nr:3'(2'),5'-bisphosphate nucleotidase CysQ [Sandaracinaceae bacterium]
MLDRELVEAVKLAREAGQILMEIYATDFDVDFKGEADPVTEADRRANELLVRRLRESFPQDGLVAEETEDKSDSMRRGRCWYVDPLDGTKEFVSKNGEFSVMIGLAVDGHARLGVVYRPVGNRLYRGVVGDSAFVDVGDRTFSLGVTRVSDPRELRLVVSRSHRSASTDALVKRLGIEHETASGSVGLKVGLIAEREADLYVHLSEHSSAWDSCAPEAILRAAGGVFTDLAGDAFVYGGADLKNRRGLLACNNHDTFTRVIDVVRDVATENGLLDEPDEDEDEGGAEDEAE